MSPTSKTDLPEQIKKLYPFTPKHVITPDGYQQSYLDEGTGHAVVMLHGNPTWSFLYRDVVKTLRSSHRCIVPDHIGCGLSEKPQDWDYTLENHIRNIENLIDNELKLEQFDLIVHDWGGAIGCGYAVRHPEKIRRLVILNTAAFVGRCPKRIFLLKLPFFNTLAVRGLNAFAGPALVMATTKKLSSEVKQGFIYPYNNWHNRIATLRFVQDIPLSPHHRSWNTLQKITDNLPLLQEKPMLICWGDKDFCFTSQMADEWEKRFPKAESIRLSQAGHYVLEDAPDSICKITEFLAR